MCTMINSTLDGFIYRKNVLRKLFSWRFPPITVDDANNLFPRSCFFSSDASKVNHRWTTQRRTHDDKMEDKFLNFELCLWAKKKTREIFSLEQKESEKQCKDNPTEKGKIVCCYQYVIRRSRTCIGLSFNRRACSMTNFQHIWIPKSNNGETHRVNVNNDRTCLITRLRLIKALIVKRRRTCCVLSKASLVGVLTWYHLLI